MGVESSRRQGSRGHDLARDAGRLPRGVVSVRRRWELSYARVPKLAKVTDGNEMLFPGPARRLEDRGPDRDWAEALLEAKVIDLVDLGDPPWVAHLLDNCEEILAWLARSRAGLAKVIRKRFRIKHLL